MAYELPPLPYPKDALEPHIDALTMEIHHTKHHQAYIDNLNKALESHPDVQTKLLDDILKNLSAVPESIRTAVRNHGGGHYNHSFFWQLMKPKGGGEPTGIVGDSIKKFFGTVDAFKDSFNTQAKTVFGSGWAWLSVDADGKLIITTTPNQDSPLSQQLQPILGLDVWEHAYYLKYQNRRPDYINAWWHVINWDMVEENYRAILGK